MATEQTAAPLRTFDKSSGPRAVDEPAARRLAALADAAVVKLPKPNAVPEEIAAGAKLIRSCLESLERGEDEAAIGPLKNIPRSSPFAEWKLFVRGLAAYYRHDQADMLANWRPLDPERVPVRIAKRLRRLAGETGPSTTSGCSGPGSKVPQPLETALLGKGLLSSLRQLQQFVVNERWSDAFGKSQRILGMLRKVDSRLSKRLTEALYTPLLQEAQTCLSNGEQTKWVGKFTHLLDPPIFDPHWNRLWALAHEHTEVSHRAESFWLKFVEDLPETGQIQHADLPVAKALVWSHLGQLLVDEEDQHRYDEGFLNPRFVVRKQPDLDRRTRAIQCFRKGLELCPDLTSCCDQLIAAYRKWGRERDAAETAQQLLNRKPDYFPAIEQLARHHLRWEEPRQALPHVQRARQLKPLDRELVRLEHEVRLSIARHCAAERKWKEGRAEFAAIESLDPHSSKSPNYLVKRAIFERQANELEASARFLAQATTLAGEPAPVLLAAVVEAQQNGLPKSYWTSFDKEFSKALKAAPGSEAIGGIASYLHACHQQEIGYESWKKYDKLLRTQLGKAKNISLRHEDLRAVCSYLEDICEEAKTLYQHFVGRAYRQIPNDPMFCHQMAALEIEKGPIRCDVALARQALERAKAAIEANPKSPDADRLPEIKSQLTFLGEVRPHSDDMEYYEDEDDEYFDDDDEEDEAEFGGMPDFDVGGMPFFFRSLLEEMCRKRGIDPQRILDDMAAGRLPHMPGFEPPPKKKPKPKKKR